MLNVKKDVFLKNYMHHTKAKTKAVRAPHDRKNKCVRIERLQKVIADCVTSIQAALVDTKIGAIKPYALVDIPRIIIKLSGLAPAIESVGKSGAQNLQLNLRQFKYLTAFAKHKLEENLSILTNCIRQAYINVYGEFADGDDYGGRAAAAVVCGILHSKFGLRRQGFHIDDEYIDQHTMFFSASPESQLHIATELEVKDVVVRGETIREGELIGKELVTYKAGQLLILRPMLPHAGAEYMPRKEKNVNTRLFFTVGYRDSDFASQRWIYETGNNYNLPREGYGKDTFCYSITKSKDTIKSDDGGTNFFSYRNDFCSNVNSERRV